MCGGLVAVCLLIQNFRISEPSLYCLAQGLSFPAHLWELPGPTGITDGLIVTQGSFPPALYHRILLVCWHRKEAAGRTHQDGLEAERDTSSETWFLFLEHRGGFMCWREGEQRRPSHWYTDPPHSSRSQRAWNLFPDHLVRRTCSHPSKVPRED